jgi:hypothetical protein
MTGLPDGNGDFIRARSLLHDTATNCENLALNRDFSASTLLAVPGMSTVPQRFVSAEHIGARGTWKTGQPGRYASRHKRRDVFRTVNYGTGA